VSIAVGLVGFGVSARILQRPLLEAAGLCVHAVVTRQAEAVKAVLPGAQAVPDVPALLALPQLDLVIIATPNHLHFPQALAALEQGKHVVIDKPMALTLAECDRLIEAAERCDRRLAVFQNRRWDSDFLTLRRLLAEQALGEVLAFEARWDRYRPGVPDRWRERPEFGGGLLYDLGAHLIDQALCLFGMPEWLQADVFSQRPQAAADDAFALRMGHGALRIELSASSIAPDASLRYRLHGRRASYRKGGLDVQEQQLREGRSPNDPQFGIEPPAQWGELTDGATQAVHRISPERGCWLDFYRAMRASIEHGSPVPVPAVEARRVIHIIEAARTSCARGARVYL